MPGEKLGWKRLFDPDEEKNIERLAIARKQPAMKTVSLEEVEPEPESEPKGQEPGEIPAEPV